MFLQQQLRFKLLHYIQKLFSASNGSGIGVFHRHDAQPGTRMPTKRAGGWLEEGANGRGTTTVVAGAGDFPCPLSMLLPIMTFATSQTKQARSAMTRRTAHCHARSLGNSGRANLREQFTQKVEKLDKEIAESDEKV